MNLYSFFELHALCLFLVVVGFYSVKKYESNMSYKRVLTHINACQNPLDIDVKIVIFVGYTSPRLYTTRSTRIVILPYRNFNDMVKFLYGKFCVGHERASAPRDLVQHLTS